jgi:hypothetical protein
MAWSRFRFPGVRIVVLGALLSLILGGVRPTPESKVTIPSMPHWSSSVLGAGTTASGGVLLNGYGGIRSFGGVTVNTAGAPTWPGWDIARAIAVLPDGSGGWTLNGWGGIAAWGVAPRLTPSVTWNNWDIARALVVLPNQTGGYVLNGWGGVVAFGTAPALSGFPVWNGWDIARGLDIHINQAGVPDGGWTLNGWGGIVAWGGAPGLPGGHVYSGFDFWQRLHLVQGGAYMVGKWGVMDTVGSAGGIDYTGMPSWGSWDIVRDVVPMGAVLPPAAPPVDNQAASALMDTLYTFDRNQRGISGLGENGTLDAIATGVDGYNLGACGGPRVAISGRAADMYQRNYFDHAIAGCRGTQFIFSTYLPAWGVRWLAAGENIAWLSGTTSLADSAWLANTMWLNSPEHYANMVSTHFSQLGCGAYYSQAGAYQGATGPLWIWSCEFIGLSAVG